MDQVFAQTATAIPPTGTAGSSSALGSSFLFIQIAVIGALFYFLILYPQKKERKKREDMLNNIQRGDRVLTRGGIYGTVADIREQIIVLKVNENSKLEVDRAYIESVEKNG